MVHIALFMHGGQKAKQLSSRFTLDFQCTVFDPVLIAGIFLTMLLHNVNYYAKRVRNENSCNCAKSDYFVVKKGRKENEVIARTSPACSVCSTSTSLLVDDFFPIS